MPWRGNLETRRAAGENRHDRTIRVNLEGLGELGRTVVVRKFSTIGRLRLTGKVSPNYLMRTVGLIRSRGRGCAGTVVESEGTLMPSYRWSRLIAVLCGVGSAVTGTSAWAFQSQPFIEEINNARHGHNPGAWVGEGSWNRDGINSSMGEFGPSLGFWQRSADGSPISKDGFPFTKLGTMPGGVSQYGVNGGDLNPPANQPPYIANNQAFGGNGQSQFGQPKNGASGADATNGNPSNGQQQFNGPNGSINPNQFGPQQPGQFSPQGWNQAGSPQTASANRTQSKVSWALDTTQQPYVGLLGQVTRPGVYEIENRGVRLGDLIKEIGGLARDASGQFRIIRNGRPGQMTSYAGATQFELMAGDLVIADAQYSSFASSTNAKPAASTAVQIGFVNLVDRPVVLKLRREHASLNEILALMRQDEGLASQIKIIAPPNQRSAGQTRPDTPLPSETVLIFPPNAVRAARLAPLPEPFKLKRDDDDDTAQQPAPRTNISPDVTQSPRTQPPRTQPSIGTWQDSQPLPQAARAVSQPNNEPATDIAEVPPPPAEAATTKRAGGVRGTRRGQDLIARDSQMVLAPPAEPNDRAPAPQPILADDLPDEPSLLNAHSQRRPILADQEQLTDLDLDDAKTKADSASSSWSIWPPILTAGVGLLALIGFSLSLRRRTQTAHAAPLSPPAILSPKPIRRDSLEAIINDQLPLTEERVPFASQMQFHGRPQPARTIRLDQSHVLPKPHLQEPVGRSQSPVVRSQESEVRSQPPAAPRTAAAATQKFRVDRSGATGTGTQVISTSRGQTPQNSELAEQSVRSTQKSSPPILNSAVPDPGQHAPGQKLFRTAGPLDRALSAVQKQITQLREERDA